MKATADFYDYTISDVSSEDTDWPSTALKDYDSSTNAFRSGDTTELTITLDLSSAVAAPHLLLYRVNFDTVQILGNATDSWGAPSYDSTEQTIGQDPEHRLYKLGFNLTGFNYRYMRIVIPNQPPVDGASYFEIGILALFETLEDFSTRGRGFNVPVDSEVTYPELINEYETKRKDVLPLIDIPVIPFNFSGNIESSVANRQRISNVFGDPAKSLVYMNLATENSWEVYLLQRMGSMTQSVMKPGNGGVKRISIPMETIL